jgi:DNA repair exonuclease SbcCD nuclease subunit
MGASALVFSDLHLHQWSYGADYSLGRNSRLEAQEKFLFKVQLYIEENNIDYCVFGGDLFHTHGKIDTEVLHVAIEGLRGIKRAVNHDCYALIGNHDIKDKAGDHNIQSLYNACGWVSASFNAPMISHNMGFISYQNDNNEFLRQLNMLCESNNPEVIFTHQGVKSVAVGSGFEIPDEVLSPDLIPPNKSVFTGHYHRHQVVAPNLTVIGSPMQHTWGDKGEDRGFIVIDLETKRWKFRPYEEAPKFVEFNPGPGNDSGLLDFEGNFVRVISKVHDKKVIAKNIKKLGAKVVEFQALSEPTFLHTSYKNFNVDQIETIISAYAEMKKADEATLEVGKSIRSGTYAAPSRTNP